MNLFTRLTHYSIFIALTSGLAACGGGSGSGGGTPSFTVSSTANLNGAISPASVSVNQNETTSFTLTPDTGYSIGTVSGCGGSLTGNTYTTGAVTANCTVIASFFIQLGAVSPLLKNTGNWNDYVQGSEWSTSSDIACNAATDTACLHGAELRVVEATGKTTCTGLTATDDLGAFSWVCDDSTGTARLISTGLGDSKYLSDLIDFTIPGFKPNAVTVYDNGATWAVTPSGTWWANSVEVNNSGGSLSTASTIFLATSNPTAAYTLDADKVALVIQPGMTLTSSATGTNVVESSSQNYLWLEGSIDASGNNTGVNFTQVNFSMLHKLTSNNANKQGIYFFGSYNTLSDVTVDNNGIQGAYISSSPNTTSNSLFDVKASNNGDTGIFLSSNVNSTLSNLIAANNGSHGVYLSGATNNTITGVMATNNYSYGVYISSGSNNTLSDITATNNRTSGITLDSSNNNTLSGVTVANNNYTGIIISSNNNTLSSIAVANNGGLLDDVSAAGARIAVAANNTFSDMTVTNSTYYGFSLFNASNNTFTGLLKVGNNGTDCSISGGTAPGLTDITCATNGSSNFTLTTNVTLANSFIGKVTTEDTQNLTDASGGASHPVDPTMIDWFDFENTYRSWGIDGSSFPNQDHQSWWTTGAGRIWDWSISTGDTGSSGSPALLKVLTLPTGNDTLTHTWSGTPASNDNTGCDAMVANSSWSGTSSTCETTFLRNAVEIQDDDFGNNNTLCETGETCLYMPNIGSYQGHGNLISAGVFTDGTLIGVTLMKHENNGR